MATLGSHDSGKIHPSVSRACLEKMAAPTAKSCGMGPPFLEGAAFLQQSRSGFGNAENAADAGTETQNNTLCLKVLIVVRCASTFERRSKGPSYIFNFRFVICELLRISHASRILFSRSDAQMLGHFTVYSHLSASIGSTFAARRAVATCDTTSA